MLNFVPLLQLSILYWSRCQFPRIIYLFALQLYPLHQALLEVTLCGVWAVKASQVQVQCCSAGVGWCKKKILRVGLRRALMTWLGNEYWGMGSEISYPRYIRDQRQVGSTGYLHFLASEKQEAKSKTCFCKHTMNSIEKGVDQIDKKNWLKEQ